MDAKDYKEKKFWDVVNSLPNLDQEDINDYVQSLRSELSQLKKESEWIDVKASLPVGDLGFIPCIIFDKYGDVRQALFNTKTNCFQNMNLQDINSAVVMWHTMPSPLKNKEMEKIKWNYDKKNNMWYALETKAYNNDGFTIRCPDPGDNTYGLRSDLLFIGTFRKLSSAKKVAELLRSG